MPRQSSSDHDQKKSSASTVGEFEKTYQVKLDAAPNMHMTTYLKKRGQLTFAKVLEDIEKTV
jgi:hypothetical protein